jgi:hypothetical protein
MADPMNTDDDEYVPGPGVPINDPPGVTIKNGPVDEAHSSGTQRDDTFYPEGGVDFISTYGGHDTIVVTPDIGTVYLLDFSPTRDTVVFSGFRNFDSFDDVKFPYVTFIPSDDPNRPFHVIEPTGTVGRGSVVFDQSIIIDYLNSENIKFEGRIDAIDLIRVPPSDFVERDLVETAHGGIGLVGLDDRADFGDFIA